MSRQFTQDRTPKTRLVSRPITRWLSLVALVLGSFGSAQAAGTSNELEALIRGPQTAEVAPAAEETPAPAPAETKEAEATPAPEPAQEAVPESQPEMQPAPAAEGEAVFSISARPLIMSSMAKYLASDSSKIPTATFEASNQTNETLGDLRVRFRVEGFSSWSKWHRLGDVAPGAATKFEFYPVFDLEKLADLNGARPVKIEMEHSYFDKEGNEVTDSDAVVTQLLGRNLVHYSRRPSPENKNFKEFFDLSSLVLASFVTTDDPVMQALAGEVSNLAGVGGVGAGYTDEDATKFAAAMFNYMKQKQIAYTSPTSRTIEGYMVQHIKYGRDVLRNRSGTCIDLAITYGSVFEAVGLEPVLCMVPGHCFPGFVLPQSRKILVIESTMLHGETFQQAVNAAQATLDKYTKQDAIIAVNIQKVRDQGVQSMELAKLDSADIRTLTKLENPRRITTADYRTNQRPDQRTTQQVTDRGQRQTWSTRQTNARPTSTQTSVQTSTETETATDSEPVSTSSFNHVGTWSMKNWIDGYWVELTLVMSADGSFTYTERIGGQVTSLQTGNYAFEQSAIKVMPSNGEMYYCPFRVLDGNLEVYFRERGSWIWFVKKA